MDNIKLMYPTIYLTQKEIDENLLYIDTDYFYINKKIQHKTNLETKELKQKLNAIYGKKGK